MSQTTHSELVIEVDDFDYGIDNSEKTVRFVVDDIGTKVAMVPNEIFNPFFVSLDGGNLNIIDPSDIYKFYKRVFVLCMADTYNGESGALNVFSKILDKTTLKTSIQYFNIVTAPLALLKINKHKHSAFLVSNTDLEIFFGHSSTFENNEIIVPILEMKYKDIKTYLTTFDKSISIASIPSLLKKINYYTGGYDRPIWDRLKNILTNIHESSYWTNHSLPNITEEFTSRNFTDRSTHKTNIGGKYIESDKKQKEKEKNLPDGVAQIVNNIKKNSDKDYLQNINNFQKKEFTDGYASLIKDKHRTYFAKINDETFPITKEDVTSIVESLKSEKQLIYFVNALIVSKDLCHFVLNNQSVLTKMAPFFEKYAPLYKYLFGYPWLSMYLEECIFKTKTKKENRYIFDINTASKLPDFPVCAEDLLQNPYLPLQINKTELNSMENLIGLGYIADSTGYGICSFDDFKWRFNLMTTGDPTKNILDGIDWKSFAVSGSIMPACMQKRPALLSLVDGNSEQDKWISFFNSYYSESDIDLMCNDLSIFGFIEKVDNTFKKIKENIPNCTEIDVKFEPFKSLIITVTDYFTEELLKEINDIYKCNWTKDDIITNIGSFEIKEYLYTKYVKCKFNTNLNLRMTKTPNEMKNDCMRSYLQLTPIEEMNIVYSKYNYINIENSHITDSDTEYYINDFRQDGSKVSESENFMVIKISENIKYKISSPKMLRTIELFRAKTTDFFGTVAKFHLACVRAYYQGDNVYMTPSCVSALKTGINIDYKYFAGLRDPVEIINKYISRGFGVILNKTELTHFVEYNTHSNNPMFVEILKDNKSGKGLVGPKTINCNIYKTLVYTKGMPIETYKTIEHKYITTMTDLKEYYLKKYKYDTNDCPIDMFKYKVFNNNGDVIPLQMGVFELYYNHYNRT
jgi:hypothetical protein